MMSSETLDRIKAEVARMRWPTNASASVENGDDGSAVLRVYVKMTAGDTHGPHAVFKLPFCAKELAFPWVEAEWSTVTMIRALRDRVANWIAYGDEYPHG